MIFSDTRFDYAFAIWGNSTLGLVSHWWHANKQVAGRGAVSIRSTEPSPCSTSAPSATTSSAAPRPSSTSSATLQLQPAYLADADPNRALLDRRVICDLLNFDEPTYVAVRRLAAKWCAEPSVHGGKRRPRNAKLII